MGTPTASVPQREHTLTMTGAQDDAAAGQVSATRVTLTLRVHEAKAVWLSAATGGDGIVHYAMEPGPCRTG